MNWKPRYIALLMALAVLVGAAGSYIGIEYFGSGEQQSQSAQVADKGAENFGSLSADEQKEFLKDMAGSEDLKKIEQAMGVIKKNYVEEVDDKKLVEGAVQGMLDTLEDPYSVYMDQETMEQFNETIESSFEGIGAEVSMVNDKVTIVAPIKGSPRKKRV